MAMTKGLADANPDIQKEYAKLIEYNYVATVDLTLKVTESEAVTPSISAIAPFAHMGTNFTMTLGGQITGSQDRNFDFNYYVNLATLAKGDNIKFINASLGGNIPVAEEKDGKQRPADGINCPEAPGTDVISYIKSDGPQDPSASEIAGDIGVGEILDNGLTATNEIGGFDLYGTKGPKTKEQEAQLLTASHYLADKADVAHKIETHRIPRPLNFNTELALTLQNTTQNLDDVQSTNAPNAVAPATLQAIRSAINKLNLNKSVLSAENRKALPQIAAKTNAAMASSPIGPPQKAPASDDGASSNSGLAKFGSTIDFNIIMGVNGGPNWTLIYFKGPTGTGGSGPLSFSRTYFDTLVVAFVPTCQHDKPAKDAATLWESLPQCTAKAISAGAATGDDLVRSMELKPLLQLGLPGGIN